MSLTLAALTDSRLHQPFLGSGVASSAASSAASAISEATTACAPVSAISSTMASAIPSLFVKHAKAHSFTSPSTSINFDTTPSIATTSSSNESHTLVNGAANGNASPQPNVNGSNDMDTDQPSSESHDSHYDQDQNQQHSAAAHGGSSTASGSRSTNSPIQPQQPTILPFIRPGDTIYEQGPPPPAPLPAVGVRNYTVLKEVGDGSFGTVWLADWHSPLALPKHTGPPGPSSRPEYRGKRLVALKRMKKAFEGGWDECMKLKELKSLRSIPMHPNIIPLYDAFLLPSSKELYFVFECMEGNLYQLTKSRKGRPLAAGLIADLFKQMLLGLDHIHAAGYFHRDMKPENLLITTTGLADYPPYLPPLPSSSSATTRGPEKDVVAIVKIADFGLARETKSKPPYTEYVSTRWYRAPEVLLRSRDYSNPVDMWAVGTILTEMINLKPLFPGQSEVDQVFRICEVMGNPSSEYGVDARNRVIGGGSWERGIKMAKSVGFQFPTIQPVKFETLFDLNQVPLQLVDIIADLMRYDPKIRLTTTQCLNHDYFRQITPYLKPTSVPSIPHHRPTDSSSPHASLQPSQQHPHKISVTVSQPSTPDTHSIASHGALPSTGRDLPPSHSHSSYARPAFDVHPHMGVPGLPPPRSSASSNYSQEHHYRERQSSVLSNDSHGLGGVTVMVDARSQMGSPQMSYPESVDINMEADDSMPPPHAPPSRALPPPLNSYNYAQDQQHQQQPNHISHHLPPPHIPHHLSHLQPHASYGHLRQGANGYAHSGYSASHYTSSIRSGFSSRSGDSGGRRGSAGGASTFYDGSIFEGIAPTRAASILSFPASYGAPPSPKFSQPAAYASSVYSQQSQASNAYLANLRRSRPDADQVSVDFEREALKRSENHSNSTLAASSSQESIKASATGKNKSGRGWMSVFNSDSNSKQPVQPHPQQQPLVHPANFPPTASSAASTYSHTRNASDTSIHQYSAISLKRTPSERSQYVPDAPAPAVQPAAPLDPKKAKKEAEKAAKEAEKLKREMAQKAARDRARAVMQKRNALQQAADPLHNFGQHQQQGGAKGVPSSDKDKQVRDRASLEAVQRKQMAMLASSGKLRQIGDDDRLRAGMHPYLAQQQYNSDLRYKARRRDDDDDVHSMSSNETRSERRFSISSRNTVSTVSTTHSMDSDPGSGRPNRFFSPSGVLMPAGRSPSLSSYRPGSHLAPGSQNSSNRRDLGTAGSGTSSLDSGLVGRFQGLTAAESDSTSGQDSPVETGMETHTQSVFYQHHHLPRGTTSSSLPAKHPQQSNIVLPSIHSFDHPPPSDFAFGNNGVPRTSQSQNSNNSTISGKSYMTPSQQGLPFTQEMYHHQQMQRQQQQQSQQQ